MAWQGASDFLARFRNLKPPKDFIKEETVNAVRIVLNISIKPENIVVGGGSVFLKNIEPSLKSKIFINKEKILKEIEKKLGHKSPKEIRF